MDCDSRVVDCLGSILLTIFALSCYLQNRDYMVLSFSVIVGMLLILNIIDYSEERA